jgi:hypothetical protein
MDEGQARATATATAVTTRSREERGPLSAGVPDQAQGAGLLP